MFEKDAKEYALGNYENCLYDDLPYTNDSRAIEKTFIDAATFGYNKAKEELTSVLRASEEENAASFAILERWFNFEYGNLSDDCYEEILGQAKDFVNTHRKSNHSNQPELF